MPIRSVLGVIQEGAARRGWIDTVYAPRAMRLRALSALASESGLAQIAHRVRCTCPCTSLLPPPLSAASYPTPTTTCQCALPPHCDHIHKTRCKYISLWPKFYEVISILHSCHSYPAFLLYFFVIRPDVCTPLYDSSESRDRLKPLPLAQYCQPNTTPPAPCGALSTKLPSSTIIRCV